MSVTHTHRPSSRDEALVRAFGATIAELYAEATDSEVSAALYRALELRGFLTVAEEQVARVVERVHDAGVSDAHLGDPSSDGARVDAAWLESVLAGRDSYVAALDDLLRTMPSPEQHPTHPRKLNPPQITTPALAPTRTQSVRAGRL